MPGLSHRTPSGPVAWMARNRVAANLLMLALLGGGLISTWNIGREYLPDTSMDAVSVLLSYPGASPEEMEQGVILAIEDAVQGLPGVDEVWSISFPGRAFFRAQAASGYNLQQLAQDVQAAVSSIRSFPEEMETPRVTLEPRRREVLNLVISGDADRLVLKDAAEEVSDILRNTGHVSQIAVQGLPRLQVNVDIAEAELRHLSLTRGEVAALLRSASVDLAAGGVKASTGEELVRVQDRRHYAREFRRVPLVTSNGGGVLRLGDVARVEDGFEDTERQATFDGKPAVMLNVFRIGDETPDQVAGAVEGSLDAIRSALSDGLQVKVLNSRAQQFSERVRLLLKNGGIGLLLVLLVLGTLLNARLAFWVMMGIPISFLGAMLVVPSLGVTINMMTLFAFILALGIVVDDAIVVGENIFAHRELGKPWARAAVDGAREVAKPVVFSVLTNVAAFTPLLFMPGEQGKLFWMIPVVVMAAFAVSLGECLFVLPAHLAHAGEAERSTPGPLKRLRLGVVAGLQRFIDGAYAPFLDRVCRSAGLMPFVALAILAVSLGYMMSGRLGYQSFPTVESDFARATVVLPFGTPARRTEAAVERMVRAAQELGDRPENRRLVKGIFTDLGEDGSHTAEVTVYLASPEVREETMSTVAFVRAWREGVGEVPGVDSMRYEAAADGPSRGHAMSLELSHRDPKALAGAADMITAKLAEYPLVTQVSHDFQAGQPQNDVRLNDVGRAMGLDANALARQLRGKFYGVEARRQLRGRDEVTVLVRGTEEERTNLHALESTLVKTPAGTFVPLSQVATVERGSAYTKIERRRGSRVVDVDADITPRSRTNHMIQQVDEVIMPEVQRRFPGLVKNLSGHQERDRRSMASLFRTFPLAMLAIFALLAVPFRSYSLALLVVGMTIPFGFVGAMLGHIVMGYSLTIPSLLGFIALTGVLVNDSLILVDFAERRRREGAGTWASMRAAATQRFRPIVLTTVTTFAGLAPMILETSRQARFLIPMAISLGFGLLFATAVVLVILPAMYVLLGRAGLLPELDPR